MKLDVGKDEEDGERLCENWETPQHKPHLLCGKRSGLLNDSGLPGECLVSVVQSVSSLAVTGHSMNDVCDGVYSAAIQKTNSSTTRK